MKRLAALLLIATASLAACQNKADQAAVAPDAKPGLALNDARLVLPAVKGNPAGGYFTLVNTSQKDVTLAAVAVTGAARAEMHETTGESMAAIANLVIKKGETVVFAPGGKHVMAFDLDPKLEAGSSSEITLTFVDGDKLSAPIKLEAPGGEMAGVDHSEHMEHSN